MVGRKFLAPPYYSQRAMFASPLSAFFIIWNWFAEPMIGLPFCINCESVMIWPPKIHGATGYHWFTGKNGR